MQKYQQLPDTFEDFRSMWNLKTTRVETITVSSTSVAMMGLVIPALTAKKRKCNMYRCFVSLNLVLQYM